MFAFVKLIRNENVGIPILSDTNGLRITNQAKAEWLNTQFASVFTSDDGKHLPDKGLSPYHEMGIIQFTQPGIEILLKNIDQTKATGPDELPARILKETAKEIAGVLSVIFQQSYEDGTVPSDWLTARISAIYKKGDKANPPNYRPVSFRHSMQNYGAYCMQPDWSSHRSQQYTASKSTWLPNGFILRDATCWYHTRTSLFK